MSAYYVTGGPSTATARSTPAPVLVAFADPAPQSRLTVAFRIFMVIPQLVVLWLLGIAAFVIVVIGWFGALFTGRLPVFAADFLAGYLRWLTRVYAYALLLTDVYPPFSLDDAEYPARVAVMPGELNRLAVLGRIFLLIPCWIVVTVLEYGAFTIFQFASWLIVLITGQMPDTIHQALASVLRYHLRALGFALMLTSAYPAGLFGDPQARAPWSPAAPYGQAPQGYDPQAPGYGDPQAPGYGDPQAPGYGDPQAPGYGAQSAYGVQPGYAQPGGYVAGSEPSWRLILSAAARRLVVGFLVFGVVVAIAGGVIDAVTVGNSVSALTAAEEVSTDVQPTRTILDNYSTSVQGCHGKLACVTSLDRRVASTLSTFAGQLRALQMPSQAVAANAALATAVSNTASEFARLGAATTASQYISEAQAANLQQSVDGINQAYTNLGTALSR